MGPCPCLSGLSSLGVSTSSFRGPSVLFASVWRVGGSPCYALLYTRSGDALLCLGFQVVPKICFQTASLAVLDKMLSFGDVLILLPYDITVGVGLTM